MGAFAAVVVAAVLLLAAITKLARPDEWRSQAAGLGVPSLVVSAVPFVEAVLGGLLLVQFERDVVAWLAAALFGAFTVLLVANLVRGRRPPCSCFGAWSTRPIGWGSVVRNLVFVALAVVAAQA